MPARPRNPDEEVVRAGAADLRLVNIERLWRCHARAHGFPRPTFTRAEELPEGLASALTAPVVTQSLILAHLKGADAAAPVIASAHVKEERLIPVVARDEVLIHVAKAQGTTWTAECVQHDRVVARVTWDWLETGR